jgi:hypothetical protein
MDNLDIRKQWQHLYKPAAKAVQVVDVPEFLFAAIGGDIGPEESVSASTSFQEAVQALYGVVYTLKFACKLRPVDPFDFSIMPLQGLWWSATGDFFLSKREDWCFQLMIMLPDRITNDMFRQAAQQVAKKRGTPVNEKLHLERLHEGLCIQIMHVGPYATEPATIEVLKAYARANGYSLGGKHHEIYLGDPRRASPDKLQTILRQPVRKE